MTVARSAFTHRTTNRYRQHNPWNLAKHATPVPWTHICQLAFKDAVVTTYTSCSDNTNSYSCAQCIYVFLKTLPINRAWCSNQLHNAVFTAQWELNCNNILTNLQGSKLMPLTAEARVRSQASLRDICGVKRDGGRFLLQYFGVPTSASCPRRSALNIIQQSKPGNLKKITLFRKSGTMGRNGMLYSLRSLQPALRLECTI